MTDDTQTSTGPAADDSSGATRAPSAEPSYAAGGPSAAPPHATGGASVQERAVALANERPEVAAGAAFAGGLVLALILKRLAR